MAGKTIKLTEEQVKWLTVILNLELRNKISAAEWDGLNEIFKQMVGRDHDSYPRYHSKQLMPR